MTAPANLTEVIARVRRQTEHYMDTAYYDPVDMRAVLDAAEECARLREELTDHRRHLEGRERWFSTRAAQELEVANQLRNRLATAERERDEARRERDDFQARLVACIAERDTAEEGEDEARAEVERLSARLERFGAVPFPADARRLATSPAPTPQPTGESTPQEEK